MSDRIIKNWVALAEYDLKTAKAMLESKRFLYVAFTCQQSIEKLLKSIYVKEKNDTPPYTHNLIRLMSALSVFTTVSHEQLEFLEMLNSYYIESRYTEEIKEISKLLTKKKAEDVFLKTKDLFKWLKKEI